MMQVVRMQNFRNISPMSDLAWSGVGCPPLFLLLSVRKRNSRQPKTGALPAGRGSIIIHFSPSWRNSSLLRDSGVPRNLCL